MKTKLFLTAILIAALSGTSIKAKAQAVDVNDSLTLVDLYNSTGGPSWYNNTNWLNGPVSTWYGVTVTGTRVTQLNLSTNNLTGPIPASIGKLTEIGYLVLSYNNINDTIPASIGNITKLVSLQLFNNQLSEKIPSSVSNLLHLELLYLHNNQLSGSIPASIGTMPSLHFLNLSHNRLTGTIPSSIYNLTNLNYLIVDHNHLKGTISPAIGNLTQLTFLHLDNNQFSGNIPYTIGNLVNIFELGLSHNHLTGTIPTSFSNFNSLVNLDLSNNMLSENTNITFARHKPKLNADISNNRFTFNGLEVIAQNIPKAKYAPQALVAIHQQGNTLSVSAGGTLSNNTYYWFKAGETGSTSSIAGDSTFHPTQNGLYYAQITNSIAAKLMLMTDTVNYMAAMTNQPINTISVYPNPAKGALTIQGLNEKRNNKITIADISGSVWLNATVNMQATAKYNISRLKPGNYIVYVNDGTETRAVQFIKK